MMLNCREVTRLVSQGLDRRLGWGERLRLRLHFLLCDGCANFRRHVLFLRRAMARLADSESPDRR
jgi:putative zinc finger protein